MTRLGHLNENRTRSGRSQRGDRTVNDRLLARYRAKGDLRLAWKEEDYARYLADPDAHDRTSLHDRPVYPEECVAHDIYAGCPLHAPEFVKGWAPCERPSAQRILTDFKRARHPYFLADAARFAEIRELVKTDAVARQWHDNVLREARGEDAPAVTLAAAYRLTGNRDFAERAWTTADQWIRDPEAGFHGRHGFLQSGGALQTMAFLYDSLFDYLSPEQRREFAEHLLVKGVRAGLFYHQTRAANFVWSTVNWSPVCENGLLMAALCTMDIEPEISARLISYCVGAVEKFTVMFYPDGGYEEGPGYWWYANRHFVNMLAVLESAFGTDYGLSNAPGFSRTPYFPAALTTGGGEFNFHDSVEKDKPFLSHFVDAGAEFLWFAERFDNPDFYNLRLQFPEQRKEGGWKDLIWYRPRPVGSTAGLPLNYFAAGVDNAVGTGMFRTSWTDPDGMALGFHAGRQNVAHFQYDAGTFVLDAGGVRWAVDPGDGRGDADGYFGGKGERLFYRRLAEGHNTLVINPNGSPGQRLDANPRLLNHAFADDVSFAVFDLTSAYDNAIRIVRRFELDRSGQTACVTDEVELREPGEIYWFMHTRAEIEIGTDGRWAVLSSGDHQLRVCLEDESDGVFAQMPARSLASEVINMRQGIFAGPPIPHKLVIRLVDVNRAHLCIRFAAVKSKKSCLK